MVPKRSAAECLLAARRLHAAGELHGALQWVDRARQRDPKSAEAILFQSELRRQLDWMCGWLEPIEEVLRLEPDRTALRLSLIREYLEYSEPDAALRHVEEGVRQVSDESPDAAEFRWLRVEALLAANRTDAVIAHLKEIEGPVIRKAQAYLRAGAVDDALACAEQLPDDPRALLLRARVSLWAGRYEEAWTQASAAAARQSGSADIESTLAAIRIATGHSEDGRAHLDRALNIDPNHPEALVLAGELARRGGAEGVESLFERAYGSSRSYLLALDINRTLLKLQTVTELRGLLNSPTATFSLAEMSRRFPAAAHALTGTSLEDARVTLVGMLNAYERSDLLHDVHDLRQRAPELFTSPEAESPSARDAQRVFEGALDRLSGNRSITPTCLHPGARASRIWVRPDPRTAAMQIRQGLKVHGFDAVIAAYDALLDEYHHHPLIHTHRGEVLLWAGRYAAAAADFEAVLQRSQGTTWAHVGLASARLLQGAPDAARSILEGARWVITAGPTAAAIRGEACRRLGNFEQARSDLNAAVHRRAGRVSAWVNLALLELRESRLGEARHAVEEAARRAPGIFRDLAQERGGRITLTRPEQARDGLDHLLSMMRGNRSSAFITYFTADDRPHLIQT